MQVLVERGAGLDVHRDSITAVVLAGKGVRMKRELRKFGTTWRDLISLRLWLQEHRVTHVAMEATGVYWLPVLQELEGRFEMVVANAHHIKNLPGRKTDACDAEWLAQLLRHGLIKGSFVPPPWQRQLRVLTRQRRAVVESTTRQRNQILKLLESIGIKLAGVLTDVFGVTGMAILRELVNGNEDAERLAGLARGRLIQKIKKIAASLEGRTLQAEHRLVLGMQLKHLEQLHDDLTRLDAAIDKAVAPYQSIIVKLCQIPGVDRVVACVVLAEIGPDLDCFATQHHLAAWSGLCPGNARSANRSKPASTRKGNVHLKTALVQAAVCASRTKSSRYLRDKYRRIAARRGPKRAAVAVAHKIVVAIYHMLKTGADYKDLGPTHLDERQKQRTINNLLKRLRNLGYQPPPQTSPQQGDPMMTFS